MPLISSAQCLGVVEHVANIADGLLVEADSRARLWLVLRENLVTERDHSGGYGDYGAQRRQPDA
jgi:hypothetical protein